MEATATSRKKEAQKARISPENRRLRMSMATSSFLFTSAYLESQQGPILGFPDADMKEHFREVHQSPRVFIPAKEWKAITRNRPLLFLTDPGEQQGEKARPVVNRLESFGKLEGF